MGPSTGTISRARAGDGRRGKNVTPGPTPRCGNQPGTRAWGMRGSSTPSPHSFCAQCVYPSGVSLRHLAPTVSLAPSSPPRRCLLAERRGGSLGAVLLLLLETYLNAVFITRPWRPYLWYLHPPVVPPPALRSSFPELCLYCHVHLLQSSFLEFCLYYHIPCLSFRSAAYHLARTGAFCTVFLAL